MAKRLEEIPELQGLRDALAFVELAKDAGKTRAVVDRLGKVRDEAQAAIAENNRQYEDILKRERELQAGKERLDRRLHEVGQREANIGAREARASDEMERARRTVSESQERIAKREQEVVRREKAVAAAESAIKAREEAVAKAEREVSAREKAAAEREKRFNRASDMVRG